MACDAKVIEDSINPHTGQRLITLQLRYWRSIHCYSADTNVLAEIDGERGFYPFPRVVGLHRESPGSVLVAAYHENGNITFQVPQAVVDKHYKGQMVECANHQQIGFKVDPNHRMWVGSRKSKHDLWEIVLAKDLAGGTQKRFEKSGHVIEQNTYSENQAKLIGFFIGDGTLSRNKCVFHLKKTRKIEYLENLLNLENIWFEKAEYKDGTVGIRFSEPIWFPDDVYENGEKRIPKSITTGGHQDIDSFINGIWFSDGSTDKGSEKIFNTSSKQVAESLCALAAMVGRAINNTGRYSNGVYKLTCQENTRPVWRKDKYELTYPDYDGMLYCVTVSTGLLVTQYQGKALVCGNCEFMTHRVFSRNASSSRAIPINTFLKQVWNDPAGPIHWGVNRPGMQANEELQGFKRWVAQKTWNFTGKVVCSVVWLANKVLKPHKQTFNRLLEPWQYISVVVTATEWDNFFELRNHKDAQPEIKELAEAMWNAMQDSKPVERTHHLPYVAGWERREYPIPVCYKLSTARCARVSYLTHDGNAPDPDKDIQLHDRLVAARPIHASPTEHCAEATIEVGFNKNFHCWKQYRVDVEQAVADGTIKHRYTNPYNLPH